MNTSLVTGGAGFIGSHVVDALIARGHKVVCLDNLSGGFRDNVHPEATFVEGDICDHELINRLFEEHHFKYVFHLAAYAAEGLSHFIKRYNYNNNVIGSMNLINASVNYNVKGFVFTSSIAVYGSGQLPLHEEMLPIPEDSYGMAKYAVERELEMSHRMFGLNYIIFRPHNVYGERQNIGDRYRNVIGIFMNQLMQNQPLTVFGDGTQTRAFTYILDVAPAIAESIENPTAYGKVFNIGAEIPYSVNELAAEVGQAMELPVNLIHLSARDEVQHAYSSNELATQVLEYKSQYTLTEGLQRMAAWAKEAGPRQTKPFTAIEIEKNLPSSWRNQ